jgi:hypothetical protein
MSESFAVLEQFCYWPPDKFKRLAESSHFSGVFREPLPDGLLRCDLRRRIEIDSPTPSA